MKVGIPKEIAPSETRVSVIPNMLNVITKLNHEVLVEKEAGKAAGFSDQQYIDQGAQIVNAGDLYSKADIVLKIQSPIMHPELGKHESELLKEGAYLISFLSPTVNPEGIKKLSGTKTTAFDMGFVPRITRAQSMDALSSMATVAGYKAVIMAADYLGKMFPLMMTAAGTVPPSNVLVLGAGVAGLQAIATAKRLGARVSAFDPRLAVKEQVESLGAKFVEMEMPEDAETEGGYAKEMSDEFLKKEQEAIAKNLNKVDIVITTAQIFGKASPILITEEMIKMMHPGSVIIDLATENGGNTELTEKGKIEKHGVIIHGVLNLPAEIPVHASQMYSKNITNLFHLIFKDDPIDWEDEITKGACVVKDGEIVNKLVAGIVG
ncbi:MAG: Re/Si-specific NAD(P)(+) transhydrogenase subunit alpha [Calditrichaeota bacterium]|nr:MAG: Re/Si-specific NAD(P)(+) transhydrogenase subunit alpha [Calditrichota bacterium]MBL1205068.1 Re/Si-specific NAD(P)(+) transhydrogenase subunit alpha [Calditrichota bacterium]NOG44898.1 Re/Si-specific NAD(P)(+) transhydrogenase subunit alpha [Calditrichota bacterium]